MSKWHGIIGFSTQERSSDHPSVVKNKLVEKPYYGEMDAYAKRWQNGTGTIDDLNVTAQLSVIMDQYLTQHIGEISYISWYGQKWKVTSVQPGHPRMIISIGGVYNVEK